MREGNDEHPRGSGPPFVVEMKPPMSTEILASSIPSWAVTLLLTLSTASVSASWSRTWSDEFDNKVQVTFCFNDLETQYNQILRTIDAQKWIVLEGDGCDSYQGCGWGVGLITVASTNNTYINDDGHLVIVARYTYEDPTVQHQSYDDRDIRSARLSTFGSADFLHGYVEVRAKVAPGGWGGWSGIWLLPSEDRGLPRASCARVNVVEVTKDIDNSATASLHFGRKDSGCVSSDSWPHHAGGCTLSLEPNVALSEDFHVYSLEWSEKEFRWFLDGVHYCTKNRWFAGIPDAKYPAPFDKAFHVEMGLAVGGLRQGVDSSTAAVGTSAMPVEMLVDYVQISQGPSGSWWSPPKDFLTSAINQDPRSLSYLHPLVLDITALVACVVGPFMAMTGLSCACFNTWLMGVEIGAFKAANISFIVSRSFMVAFVAGILFGILIGYLAIRHQTIARWNTVGALSVPTLFLLIDIGMISGIGSRYVCWALFGVLTVTYAVLAFPSEHHENAFRIGSAATGSCVLKLGLGRLIGAPGEIFKIFDDPLGDRCYESRACRTLGWVAVSMLVVGLCVQWSLVRKLPKSASSAGASGDDPEDGSRTFSAPHEFRTSIDKRANGADTADLNGSEESQGAVGQLGRGEIDGNVQHPGTHGSQACRGTFLGFKSMLGMFYCISPQCQRTYRAVDVSDTHNDSPTPVPVPSSGAHFNTTISSKGDTIEFVVQSPNMIVKSREQRPRRSLAWEWIIGRNGTTEGGEQDLQLSLARTPSFACSSGGGVDGDGHVSTARSLGSQGGKQQPLPSLGPTLTQPSNVNRGEPSSGQLAQAFSKKWGSWLGGRSPGDNENTTGHEKRQRHPVIGDRGHNTTTTNITKLKETARGRLSDLDDETLSLSSFNRLHASTSPAGSTAFGENIPLFSDSSSSCTLLADRDEEWMRDSTSTEYDNNVCAAYTVTRKEALPPRDATGVPFKLTRQVWGKASNSSAALEKRGRSVADRSSAVNLQAAGGASAELLTTA